MLYHWSSTSSIVLRKAIRSNSVYRSLRKERVCWINRARYAIEQGHDYYRSSTWGKLYCLTFAGLLFSLEPDQENVQIRKKKNTRGTWEQTSSRIVLWILNMWAAARAESQTSPWHLRVNNDLSGSSRFPIHADLATTAAFQTAISPSHAAFSAILNGSHAEKPVAQLSLCQGRSEMEVIEQRTIWAELRWRSRLWLRDCGEKRFVYVVQQ